MPSSLSGDQGSLPEEIEDGEESVLGKRPWDRREQGASGSWSKASVAGEQGR